MARPARRRGWWGFEFAGDPVNLGCIDVALSCNLNLGGEVKKGQDSSGAWRIGRRVTSASISPSHLMCAVAKFPWCSKGPSITSHCPFANSCDSFIPYNPSAPIYTAKFGAVDTSVLGVSVVDNEHLHGTVFTQVSAPP